MKSKQQKRKEAAERQAVYDALSPMQKYRKAGVREQVKILEKHPEIKVGLSNGK